MSQLHTSQLKDLFIIGIDVGSTTTDCALINHTRNNRVECSFKTQTTRDITKGILAAIEKVCEQYRIEQNSEDIITSSSSSNDSTIGPNIMCVIIGTTHFVNAILSFSPDLERVGICRLTSTANECLPPCASFPDALRQSVFGDYFKLDGGYEVDGREMYEINKEQVFEMCQRFQSQNLTNIVVSGVFSPINEQQEEKVAEYIREFYHDRLQELKITCSHTISEMGFMQRENASILNATLKGIAQKICRSFQEAIGSKYDCPFFLTQNDGTVMSPSMAMEFPIFAIQSGPTNSMKGAAFLSKIENAIVVDIGGLTTDVGVLVNGFPRLSNTNVSIGNVLTNFRVPDVHSIALGGGSIVSSSSQLLLHQEEHSKSFSIGPQSVGYNIFKEALIFGGETTTTTDIAVACGLLSMESFQSVLTQNHNETLSSTTTNIEEILSRLNENNYAQQVLHQIHQMVEDAIDHVKTSSTPLPVLLVGGGSVLIDEKNRTFEGTSQVLKPQHYQCANAVGAALAQVSGRVDKVLNIDVASMGSDHENMTTSIMTPLDAREHVIESVKQQAKEKAIRNGARPETVEIIDFECIPLAYVPGNTCRFICKAVGQLDVSVVKNSSSSGWKMHDNGRDNNIHDSTDTNSIQQVVESNNSSRNNAALSSTSTSSNSTSTSSEPRIMNIIENSTLSRREWILTPTDVDYLEIGSGIISSGGGGSPRLASIVARNLIRKCHHNNNSDHSKHHPIKIIQPQDLSPDAFVLPLAVMGAPLVLSEKFFVEEFVKAIETMKNMTNKKIEALFCAEIGGSNSITPLLVSAWTGIPVVDADGMGRALPELQMISYLIYGGNHVPAMLCDDKSNHVIVSSTNPRKPFKSLEELFRPVVVSLGSMCGLLMAPISKEQVLKYTVKNSYSGIWRIGKSVSMARHNFMDPVKSIFQAHQGKLIFVGKIVDVDRKTTSGFNVGKCVLQGNSEFQNMKCEIDFQNEFLVATLLSTEESRETTTARQRTVLGSVPDIIAVVDSQTGLAIQTEELRFGFRVSVLCLACPDLYQTEQALKVVGPKAFGYSDIELNCLQPATFSSVFEEV
ncbi:hypothetical protein C9374_007878 [Naegleria lovaniensis]|uniref:Hydantoinase/oxoprolinase n=1 Tax=Naegleria lovaniensis TaxID=51637 RepID=A0AA88KGL8_NAELO|nr:uncharacterized protein C9374_007878 [Naegleria lovaniensis]KAG2378730.1 hypothetical protein C9374_007878 [Naegleria lovaniensis]